MQAIKITVTGSDARVTEKPVITSGMVGLPVEFTFDEAWDGLGKTAVFRAGSRSYPVSCVQSTAIVPWEVLEKPNMTLHIGVFGTDGDATVCIPTVWAQAGTIWQGTQIPDTVPQEPTPQVYDQILAAANEAVEMVNDLREDADAGKFIGPPGPKGDAGVVEFIVVAQLPTQDIKNAIYLVPAKDADGSNLFAEYIYVDGKWEQIGSASVEINLEEFVKKTDYATTDNTGVIRVGTGLKMAGAILQIHKASDGGINSRASDYNPIVPSNLDYAVRASLTNPKNVTWTDENKSSARETLGAASDANTVKQVQYDSGYKYPGGSDGTYYGLLYARKFDDTECRFPVCGQSRNFTIPVRDHTGNFYVNTPTSAYHCTTKGYVDNLIAGLTERIAELESKLAAQ